LPLLKFQPSYIKCAFYALGVKTSHEYIYIYIYIYIYAVLYTQFLWVGMCGVQTSGLKVFLSVNRLDWLRGSPSFLLNRYQVLFRG